MTLFLDAYNLDIPDEVMEHPIIVSLGEAANDLVTWSNVSVSSRLCASCPYFFFPLPLGHLFIQRRTIQRRHAQHDSRRDERRGA